MPSPTNPVFLVNPASDNGATGKRWPELAHRAARAFISWVTEQQNQALIPASQRVQFRLVNDAKLPTLVTPRKKTLPRLKRMPVAKQRNAMPTLFMT